MRPSKSKIRYNNSNDFIVVNDEDNDQTPLLVRQPPDMQIPIKLPNYHNEDNGSHLIFRDVNYYVTDGISKSQIQILENVSGAMCPGEMTALMV